MKNVKNVVSQQEVFEILAKENFTKAIDAVSYKVSQEIEEAMEEAANEIFYSLGDEIVSEFEKLGMKFDLNDPVHTGVLDSISEVIQDGISLSYSAEDTLDSEDALKIESINEVFVKPKTTSILVTVKTNYRIEMPLDSKLTEGEILKQIEDGEHHSGYSPTYVKLDSSDIEEPIKIVGYSKYQEDMGKRLLTDTLSITDPYREFSAVEETTLLDNGWNQWDVNKLVKGEDTHLLRKAENLLATLGGEI